jgi:hypothetical protein
LAATSALTATSVAAHASAPSIPPAITAPADVSAADHAEHAQSEAKRSGVWRAIAGTASAIGSGAAAILVWIRRLGASKIVKPALKAATATARLALGGASAMGRVGLWTARTIVGVLAGVVGLLLALAGLDGGAGAMLVTGAVLGSGAAALAVWAMRRALFRRRRAAA